MQANDKINILLVDDQPGKLLSYEVVLNDLDANLIKANSATEALEHLLKHEIAVVLVDVCMPDFDGFQLAQMIREHPRFEQTAIIFISAVLLSEMDHVRGYSLGAVDYVPVPVVPEVLRAKVKVFADLYRKTRALERLNQELEGRVAMRTAELEASNQRLLDSEQRRSFALAAGHMGSWDWDLLNNQCVWDEGQCKIFGVDPGVFVPELTAIRAFFADSEWRRLVKILAKASVDNASCQTEVEITRADGTKCWCILSAAGSFDEAGRLIRVSGVTIDITARKDAEEHQLLLAREVDHRARNTLAIVQAIVRLTKAKSTADYITDVEGRIQSLAATHNLLSATRWIGADMERLVREELAPYCQEMPSKLVIDGRPVTLTPDRAQTVGLAIHELATNAAKYGALSCDTGTVRISWRLSGGEIALQWQESGGPRVTPPKSKGFGTKIINSSVKNHGSSGVTFDWQPEGLRCTLVIPLTNEVPGGGKTEEKLIRIHPKEAKKLLLAEDETLVGMMMRDLLSDAGFFVVGPIASLDEAIGAARSFEFDGAILDVNMGGTLVYPLAELLSQRGIPFIFITGYDDDSIDARFASASVLQKPLDPEKLKFALEKNFGGLAAVPPMPGKSVAHVSP
jgi:two-component sensor histidine kinase/DNA-binding response OmpR family regulator